MRNLLNHWATQTLLFLGLSLAATGIASAQATVTAQRGAELTPFVESTLISPDWGPTRDIGYTAGIDYTRFTRVGLFQPSLELRFADATGSTVNEHSFTGGFKLETEVHGIHPYATLLAGDGRIIFVHPIGNYFSDDSFVYSIGAGAEFNVLPDWKVRLDYVQQFWNIEPQSLTPIALSVGVAYRVHFHNNGWAH